MTPEDLIAAHIEVVKREKIELMRQHIRVTDQGQVPETVFELARMFRAGRATAKLEVMFNQGGCKAIVTEQVTAKEID